jgi:hypothetical protein
MKIGSIKTKSRLDTVNYPLPSNEAIIKLSQILIKQNDYREKTNKYAPVKQILSLIGFGAVISAAILAPKSAPLLIPLVKKSPDYNMWKKYNISYLHRTLKRLEEQKQIQVEEIHGERVVVLSNAGKRKILHLSLETLQIERPKNWDHKWRLVLYDIPDSGKHWRDAIKSTLKTIGFYQIQKSVYIYPYSCFEQIEFIREYYSVGKQLQYMLVDQIEDDEAYKTYFDLT